MLRHSFIFLTFAVIYSAFETISTAQEPILIFKDHFNRADSDDGVGNEWSAKGALKLKNKAALFQVDEEEFRPRMSHRFAIQKTGKVQVSFLLDWLRTTEGTWAFYMQLGHSSEMPRILVRKDDLAKGTAVNLLWGGGEMVDSQPAGSFGYFKNGKFESLFVVNDAKSKSTLVKKAVVKIEIDIDAKTYSVQSNGKTYAGLPFENNVPIDSIRFVTDGCSASGFAKTSIDEVVISKNAPQN